MCLKMINKEHTVVLFKPSWWVLIKFFKESSAMTLEGNNLILESWMNSLYFPETQSLQRELFWC